MEKNFAIRCSQCKWVELSTGISADLTHLKEIPNNCPKCGKPRTFYCPACKSKAKMFRLKTC